MKKTFKHNDFTATFEDENGCFSLTGNVDGSSGACGNEIAKIDKQFKLINEMHLSDCKTGQPLHALENGFYHYEKDNFLLSSLEKYWGVKLSDNATKLINEGLVIYLKLLKTNSDYSERLKYRTKKAERYKEINPSKAESLLSQIEIEIENNINSLRVSNENFKDNIIGKIMEEEAKPLWKEKAAKVYELVKSIPSDLTEIDEDISLDDFMEEEKVQALAKYLDCHFSEIEEGRDYFKCQGQEFRVLTDSEADTAQDEYLDYYIEDCLLPVMEDSLKRYFDVDKWKSEARQDGRGHCLASYDGDESCETINNEEYYIYRV